MTDKLGWFSILGCSQNGGTWTESPCYTSQQLVQQSTKWPKRFSKTLKSQDIEAQTGRGTSQNRWNKNIFVNLTAPWAAAACDDSGRLQLEESFSSARPQLNSHASSSAISSPLLFYFESFTCHCEKNVASVLVSHCGNNGCDSATTGCGNFPEEAPPCRFLLGLETTRRLLAVGEGGGNFSDDSAATIINTGIPLVISLSLVSHTLPRWAMFFFVCVCRKCDIAGVIKYFLSSWGHYIHDPLPPPTPPLAAFKHCYFSVQFSSTFEACLLLLNLILCCTCGDVWLYLFLWGSSWMLFVTAHGAGFNK